MSLQRYFLQEYVQTKMLIHVDGIELSMDKLARDKVWKVFLFKAIFRFWTLVKEGFVPVFLYDSFVICSSTYMSYFMFYILVFGLCNFFWRSWHCQGRRSQTFVLSGGGSWSSPTLPSATWGRSRMRSAPMLWLCENLCIIIFQNVCKPLWSGCNYLALYRNIECTIHLLDVVVSLVRIVNLLLLLQSDILGYSGWLEEKLSFQSQIN